MAQITRITSESLQATIRRLLPSQQGFGEDLQASNVITPIIDLTPAAEGSSLPYDMQTAISFGGITTFSITSGSSTIINNAGFFRVYGALSMQGVNSATCTANFSISNGSTNKDIWLASQRSTASQSEFFIQLFDFTVFLRSNDSVTGSVANLGTLIGSVRQIADVNGVLSDPAGFNPQ